MSTNTAKLIQDNDKLALHVAKCTHQHAGNVPLDSITQAARDGLSQAAQRYVAEQSTRAFGSYAHPFIKSSILKSLPTDVHQRLPFYLRHAG